ncbi:MAG: hypothetical protein Rubg2KO_12350 [Rubricoccaceae bacterium]
MVRVVAISLACLAWAGCVQCETSFPEVPLTRSGILSATQDLPGDTLTIAVIYGSPARLGPLPIEVVAERDTLVSERADGAVIELAYVLEGFVFDQTPDTQLAALAHGDTVYVYVQGTVDLIQETCPPSEGPNAVLDVQSVRAPPAVQAAIVTMIGFNELAPDVLDRIHRADAEPSALFASSRPNEGVPSAT